MKVVVPYTSLKQPTRLVLKQYKPEYVDVSGPDAYRRLLQRIWTEGETTIIVEHDVVPWPGALDELWQCPCAWGAYSYHMHGGLGIYHGLGCTKIGAELIARTPTVWHPPHPWNVLDQMLLFASRGTGLEPHHHRPAVTHLNAKHYPKGD